MTARTLKTGPTKEPVPTDVVKDHLRITTTDEDYLIESWITAAREHIETVTGRALMQQTWYLHLDAFPTVITLPKPPLSSVSAITYFDTDGVEQTLASSVYTVDTDSTPGRIYLAYNQTWPSTRSIRHAVKVEFVCGYGDQKDVPQRAKAALMMLVGHLDKNRDATVTGTIIAEVPQGVKSLLAGLTVPEAA